MSFFDCSHCHSKPDIKEIDDGEYVLQCPNCQKTAHSSFSVMYAAKLWNKQQQVKLETKLCPSCNSPAGHLIDIDQMHYFKCSACELRTDLHFTAADALNEWHYGKVEDNEPTRLKEKKLHWHLMTIRSRDNGNLIGSSYFETGSYYTNVTVERINTTLASSNVPNGVCTGIFYLGYMTKEDFFKEHQSSQCPE